CLDGDSNLAGFTTLTNYYVNWYKNEVGPMLERGAVDDMVLGAAIDEFIRWYLLPIQWGQVGLLCDSEPYLEDSGYGEDSGYNFREKASELLSKGLVNAIDTAAKVCASAHDLGEARNIAGWTAVALSLDQAYGFPIEDPDYEYGLDKLFGCVSFKLVFNTTVLVEGRRGPSGISIQSEITDMVPTTLAQLLGRDEGDTSGESTAELSSYILEGSKNCTVTASIVTRPVRVPDVEPPI
ncbi:MAG: hypothetical protein QGM48_11080, partial [Actinomycetota bacterium]|nr:hypothetical protein [Actinomycetota bacterium]